MKKIKNHLVVLIILSLSITDISAYTYAPKKEKLIEGRTMLLQGINEKSSALLKDGFREILEPLVYLDEQGYTNDMELKISAAVKNSNSEAIISLLNKLYAAEITHRLNTAEKKINEFETAKTLVVKLKPFVDTLLPFLKAEQRPAVQKALSECLEAVGTPGVFGCGSNPLNPTKFNEQKKIIIDILHAL